MENIERLKMDADMDVADATDNADVILLRDRKVLSAKYEALEAENVERDRQLSERWVKEEEERKRKAEEEEENKFDFSSFLLDTRKTVKKGKNNFKGRVGGGNASGAGKGGGTASRQLKSQSSGVQEGGGATKRKSGMTKR